MPFLAMRDEAIQAPSQIVPDSHQQRRVVPLETSDYAQMEAAAVRISG